MHSLDKSVLAELEQEFSFVVMRDLIHMTVKSAERELTVLQNAVLSKDAVTMRRLSHSMIGIFGQYGAVHASQAALEVHSADDGQIEQASKALIKAGQIAIELLKQYLSEADIMALSA